MSVVRASTDSSFWTSSWCFFTSIHREIGSLLDEISSITSGDVLVVSLSFARGFYAVKLSRDRSYESIGINKCLPGIDK